MNLFSLVLRCDGIGRDQFTSERYPGCDPCVQTRRSEYVRGFCRHKKGAYMKRLSKTELDWCVLSYRSGECLVLDEIFDVQLDRFVEGSEYVYKLVGLSLGVFDRFVVVRFGCFIRDDVANA